MAFNFPASPVINDLYTFQNKTWKWNGTGWILNTILPTGPVGATGPSGPTGPAGSSVTIKDSRGSTWGTPITRTDSPVDISLKRDPKEMTVFLKISL